MASLLSFVKRVANTVNNDVVKPIQRDVVHPVAQAGSTLYHGISPFDNGQGWTNQAPQRQAPQSQGQSGGQLQVRTVQNPTFTTPTFHVTPTAPLQVHVAPPQPLQIGNQTVLPSPQARTSSPAADLKIAQTLQQLKQLGGPPPAPLSPENLIQPIARALTEIPASITGKTITPTNPVTRALLSNQPVAPVQQDVRGVYRAVKAGHQTLPGGIPISPGLAGPYAAAAAALHIGQDVPIAKVATTLGAEVGAKGITALDAAAQKAALANPAGQIGAVGKNVNKSAGLSKAELNGMAKQNFTPDLINKAHLQAGGKLDTNGSPIASDVKAPKVSAQTTIKEPTYFSQSQNKQVPVSSMSAKYATNALSKLPNNADPNLVEALTKQSKTGAKKVLNTPLIPQTSQEGRVVKITSLENRLNRVGQSGQNALQTIRNAEIGTKVHTQQLKDIAKPFYALSPEEQSVAIKVQKGEGTTTSKAIQSGANSLQAMFKETHQRITATGKKVGNLGDNYFPRSYPKGWFDKPENFNRAVQQMVASGKAPDLATAVSKMNQFRAEGSLKPTEFGNFRTREKDLPGGIENANTVSNYIKGASKSIAENQHFGLKNKVLNEHVAQAVTNGEDAGALKKIISSYLHPTRPKPGAVTTGLSGYQKALRVIQLPRAAISHGLQGFTNTASDIGYAKYFKALGKKVFRNADTNKFLNEGGFRIDDFGKSSNISDKATAPGLGHVLQFHREVAAEGGRSMALGLAKKGDVQGLSRIGVDGKLNVAKDGSIKLTPAQEVQAGHFEANKSIGSHSPIQSPAWIQSNGGKLVGQYRKMYTFKQSERIANLFSDAKRGNVAPLARYLAIGLPLSGVPIALAKDEIKNPGSNPLNDPKKLAGDSLYDSGGLSVGYGLAGSGFNALTHNYGNDSRWSNLASAVAPGAGFAVQTGQNISKATHGKPQALQREGLRMIPVGGTALANKLVPPTLAPPGTTGSPAQQKAQAKIDSKKQLADFKNRADNGYGLNKLSDGTYVYNLNGKVHTANNIQTAQKAIRDDAFSKGTGSYKYVPNVNGTGVVVRRGADGKVTEESKVKFDYQLGTATLTMQKNSGDLKGYLSTAKSQIASIATQLKDPSTDPLEALTLQNQADALQKNIDKYTGYGGFTKPKAPKKGKGLGGFAGSGSAKYTIPKIAGAKAIKAPKGITVKRLAAFKQPRTRKLSVSKMPKIG